MAAGPLITIYALCDPDTLEPRYVGKTRDLAARLRGHRFETQNSKFHTHKVNWLRTLSSRDPVVLILAVVEFDQWEEAERYRIAEMRRRGHNLTNYAEGGQTSPVEGKGHTEETKSKLRELAIKRGTKPPSRKGTVPWNKGRRGVIKRNSTTFQKGHTPWNKGKKMSAVYIEANCRGHKGVLWSPARRAAQLRRRIEVAGE